MKAYVINMARSTDRRAHQEEQLRRLGMEYEIVQGVDYQLLAPEELDTGLPPGVTGVALGHVAAYRRVVADGRRAALVLEDDSLLPDNLAALLDSIEPLLDRPEVVLLHYRSSLTSGLDPETGRKRKRRTILPCPLTEQHGADLVDGFRLLYPLSPEPLSAATAYVMTTEGCERMIDVLLPVRFWPDAWVNFLTAGALDRVRCVAPRPAGTRTDISTQRQTDISTLPGDYSRLKAAIAAVVPARLRAWQRARGERKLSHFSVVNEPPRGPGAP